MQRVGGSIFQSTIQLNETVDLYVYCVKGPDYSVIIDSGVRSMFPQIQVLLQQADIKSSDLRFVLHTHSHHDHIGCNHQLKSATGCLIAAHPYYAAWHRDFELHYQQFALSFPDIIGDSPELRHEVFDPLDAEVPLDLAIDEGSAFYLGGSTVLEAIAFPGHMKAELGYVEHGSKTLILGDAITGLDWGFFHSHLDVQGYRHSLKKIRDVIQRYDMAQVLLSHFGPKTPDEATELTYQAEKYIDQIEYACISTFVAERSASLKSLWISVCEQMGRVPDFRALNMVNAHIEDLLARGFIEQQASTYRLRGCL